MKKLLILTAVGAILAAPATAVQRCIKLTVGMSGDFDYEEGGTGWTAIFPHITIKGQSACTDNNSTDVQDEVGVNGSGYYCWCKMSSPVESRWAGCGIYGTTEYCQRDCSHSCAENFSGNESYVYDLHEAMFNNIISN